MANWIIGFVVGDIFGMLTLALCSACKMWEGEE
jgi:hypothetical protein